MFSRDNKKSCSFGRGPILTGIVLLFFLACKKSDLPTGKYTGQLWGSYYNGTYIEYNELDIPLEMTESSESSITFNNNIVLKKTRDSISGSLIMENKDYLIDPYLVGTWTKVKKEYVISGFFSSIKDSVTLINGTFEIARYD